MATAADLLRVVRNEIGYSRWNDPESGTKYGRWYRDQGFGAYFGTSGVPYCAMFVSWGLAQVGMKPPGGYFAYCPYGINRCRAEGRLVGARDGQPGDMIFFDWDGDGVSDHVGFIESRLSGGYQTIEGNTSSSSAGSQSNGGGVYRRTRGYGGVVAVGRPAYDGSSTGVVAPNLLKGFDSKGGLIVDGDWGPSTTLAAQMVLGMAAKDGIVSSQSAAHQRAGLFPNVNPASWQFSNDPDGSQLIAAMQRLFKVDDDGIAGPVFVAAFRAWFRVGSGTSLDMPAIKAMQTRLRAGRFGG